MLPCTFTSSLPAVSPFSVSQFLETHEDEFLEIVNPKQSLLKLKHKGVISTDVRTAIEDASDEDAKYILLEHLQRNATVDTLRVYCEVAMAAVGYPRMQELGRKMMAALPPGGWLDVWLCQSVVWCMSTVCMCMRAFEMTTTDMSKYLNTSLLYNSSCPVHRCSYTLSHCCVVMQPLNTHT